MILWKETKRSITFSFDANLNLILFCLLTTTIVRREILDLGKALTLRERERSKQTTYFSRTRSGYHFSLSFLKNLLFLLF